MAEEVYTVRAMIKGVDQAPRKVALVASLVRGRTVADAVVILDRTPKRAALVVKKAIQSAAANASNNHGLDTKTLTVSTLSVTAGPRLHASSLHHVVVRCHSPKKSRSHILVEVSGAIKQVKKARLQKRLTAAEKPAKKEEK